jgi:enterochelin esterase family protein
MKPLPFLILGLLLGVTGGMAAPTDDAYKLGPDSLPQEGVPHGKITEPKNIESKVFPTTSHMYTVYVPVQYDPAKPASLMIFLDGHAYADVSAKGEYRIPNVFDNLIYRRELPVTIAVFMNPGHHTNQPDFSPSNWDANSNRPEEYNTLDDRFTRVIMDELMPELKQSYNLADDPDRHAISGASSGAIAAFTVAWHRPDYFHKVITTIGSFTNLRPNDPQNGSDYPDIIAKSDRKPIRIFLEDGINDNRGVGRGGGAYDSRRDWHGQNIKMVEALTAKGNDVNFAWTLGTHSNKHGGAIMPDMLRWLWRDYPREENPTSTANRGFFLPLGAEPAAAAAPAPASRPAAPAAP